MIHMKNILVYLACFNPFLFTYAQTAAEDFAQMNTNLSADDLIIETQYRVFESHLSQAPREVSYGILKQRGNQYYQRISSLQSLVNERLSIYIDTVEKILVVSDPVNLQEEKKKAMQVDLVQSLSNCQTVTYYPTGKNTGIYSLVFKESVETEFEKVDVYIDKKLFLPTKIILYYNETMDLSDDGKGKEENTPRLEITFTKINTNPSFQKSDFEEERFIKRKGNKIVAASDGFKVIDTRYYTK
jgi:hypothetical protein